MRKLSIILFILVLAFVTGCSSISATSSGNAPVQNSSTAGQENTQGKALSNDQKQSQEKMPDLLGKITAINQNTLEVAELKLPEGIQAEGRPNSAPGAGGKDPASMTEQERQELEQKMKEQRPAEAAQGEPARRGNMTVTYEETGKSYKLLISADTAITKRTMGKDGNTESAITIKDLKEGDILRIWVEQLNADGESKVIRAELMPVRENTSN